MSGRVLVAGASGFVGSALVGALRERGLTVRALVRRPWQAPAGVEVVRADLHRPDGLTGLLEGVGTAWYLVHSLVDPAVRTLDREAARAFGEAARAAGVEQIVYLGGLGQPDGDRTPHITSRWETGNALREAGVPVCELRAAVVIGKGSAVVEVFRRLTEHSPLMVAPKGAHHLVEPIALTDVLRYLLAPLADRRWSGQTFEIGGETVLSWRALIERFLVLQGRRRRVIDSPVATPLLSGWWMERFGGMPRSMGTQFVRNLDHDAIVRDHRARALLGGGPMVPLTRALVEALGAGGSNGRHDL